METRTGTLGPLRFSGPESRSASKSRAHCPKDTGARHWAEKDYLQILGARGRTHVQKDVNSTAYF